MTTEEPRTESALDLELFSRMLREFLHRSFPNAASKSALSIEVAHRTGMSMDHIRKIFDGKVLPMPRTFRALLALGPETKLAYEVSDLYRKLRVEFIKRSQAKGRKL